MVRLYRHFRFLRKAVRICVGVDAHIDPAEQTVFTKIRGEYAALLGPMCTGKRQTHIRNAPLSRTAVTGIGPYKCDCVS